MNNALFSTNNISAANLRSGLTEEPWWYPVWHGDWVLTSSMLN